MLSNFDGKLLDALNTYTQAIERHALENAEPNEFDLSDLFDGRSFFSVEGLADFWSTQSNVDFSQCMTDLVMSIHNQQRVPLIIVLAGSPLRVHLFISPSNQTTQSILEGILPGIHLDPNPVANLTQRLQTHLQVKGMLSGIPSSKSSSSQSLASTKQTSSSVGNNIANTQNIFLLERVIRGMHRATWAYVVHADARPRHKVIETRLRLIDQISKIASQSRIQLQTTEQESKQLTVVNTGSSTKTMSGEMINYRAQYLMHLLERELERLDQAIATGQWLVSTYFGASTKDDAQRLASLLLGTFSGKDSRPDPMRAYFCRKQGRYLSDFDTLLSSHEVATLMQLPRQEVPGYAISDAVSFDVDYRIAPAATTPSSPLISLGTIQHNGKNTLDTYSIPLHDLAKHGVVVGVTGSGKTTTLMNILEHVIAAKIPFLIIEPAKTEYRSLRNALTGKADVRIYTLGNENIAPFRLNPFEFETDDIPGSASIGNHIDFLKAVFNAAFILYAPMPYILEIALHEIYEDKGWDLATGLNSRLPMWSTRHLYPIFPTLTDLYRKIEGVTKRLGYDIRIEQDVQAGLKARIGAMRIGSKGMMLDTVRGIPMKQLLSYPTILEMENIGGDEEKTFLMGLLLAKLYEYRRLQMASGQIAGGLQHLMLFEEAHRLLKNTETQVSSETSNIRAQAIEVFTNMLSEVRAYGQGVLVAEQIPGKLAPDVLKNTNLKIVHRLIAQDDRESIGYTMNLKEEQLTHLGILTTGTAAVYAEGADHAYLVRMENYKRKLLPLSDTKLKIESQSYASVEPCLPFAHFHLYNIPRTAFGSPDVMLYQAAGRSLESEDSKELWASIILRGVFSRSQLLPLIARVQRQLEVDMSHVQTRQRDILLRLVIMHGCFETVHKRGEMFGWTYPILAELRTLLTNGILKLLQTNDSKLANADLEKFASTYYELMQRKQGPFVGCLHCRNICHYRLEVRDLLSSVDKEWIRSDLRNTSYSDEERYSAIAEVSQDIAKRWLGEAGPPLSGIGYCVALHVAADARLNDYEQTVFSNHLSKKLLT